MKLTKYKNRHIRGANSESFFNYELFNLFREGDVEIICHQSKENITSQILIRVIFDREGMAKEKIPLSTLSKAIRLGGFVNYIKQLESSSLRPPSCR